MSSSNCCFLTYILVSQETGKVVWYSRLFENFPQFVMIHTVKGFSIVNKIEVDVLEFPCLLYDPANVGNLISCSSSFSKPSLDICKFLVHVMLQSSMQDFEYPLLAWEMSATVQWLAHPLVLTFLVIGMKVDRFQSCGPCSVFWICWHNEHKTLMASSYRDLNSSAGISSPTPGLLTAVLLSPSRLHNPGCLALGEWPHHSGYLGH